MDERIHAQIVAGEISALTLDTSIFERAGLAMESGLLAQLEQFLGSDVRLVVASVVANEVRRHLADNAEKSVVALQNALHETGRHQALTAAVQRNLAGAVNVERAEIRGRAQGRFDAWVARVGATILDEAEFASIGDVMHQYESVEPPFNATGNKKHEFPDAVALSTLEGWAKKSSTKILTVTQDNDWKRYGAQSAGLVVVDDLADALAGFQRLAEASMVANSLAESIAGGDPFGMKDALLSALQRNDDSIEFVIEADSQFSFDEEWVETHFQEVDFGDPEDARNSFETISCDDNVAVIRVAATAAAEIQVHFSFDKWDGIDREYMPMGSATIPCSEQIEFEALVTVTIDAPGEMLIDDVEILPTKHQLYFSEIEPDWMSDPDSYDS